MAYAGLSGSFGTVSLGQIWSASFNHVGGITDGSWFYGNSETSYRVGNALSYAMSAGAISMQLDAVMDGGTDTGESVDQLEFGMTVSLGDIGKLGLAYVDTKDSMVTNSVFMEGTPTTVGMEGSPNIPTTVGMEGSANVPTTVGKEGSANVPTTVGKEGSANIPTTLKDGSANVPIDLTVTNSVPNVVPVSEIKLVVNDDGELEIQDATLKSDTSVEYDSSGVMHMTYLHEDGSLMSEKNEESGHTTGIMPMVITAVGSLGGQDLVENTNYRIISGKYVANDCFEGNAEDGYTILASTEGNVCGESKKFLVEYFDFDGTPVVTRDLQTGQTTSVLPQVATIVDYDNTNVAHTVSGTRVDGRTPTTVTINNADEQKASVPTTTATAGEANVPTTVGKEGSANVPTTVGKEGSANVPTTVGTEGTANVPTTVGTEGTANVPTTVGVEGTASHYSDVTSTVKGSRATHVAAQFSLGAITAYLGYSQNEENGSGMKDKTTHYGISGGLGETGISFHAMARNKDNASGMDSNPWLVGLTKGLGGGATVMVEHGNADNGTSGKTRFGLKVDF